MADGLSRLRDDFEEFGTLAAHKWWAVIVSGFLGVAAIASALTGPHVLAIALVTASVVAFMYAPFWAFRQMRGQRDDARRETEERFDAIRYRFNLSGVSGGPARALLEGRTQVETGYKIVLHFENGALEPVWYEVENLIVTIGGHTRIEAGAWLSAGGIVQPGRTMTFDYGWIPAPEEDPLPVGHGEYALIYGHPSGGTRFRSRHRFRIYWQVEAARLSPVYITTGNVTHDVAGEAT